MRKVYIKAEFRLILTVNEGIEISEVLNELDYSFQDTTGNATIEDTEMVDFEITDSK